MKLIAFTFVLFLCSSGVVTVEDKYMVMIHGSPKPSLEATVLSEPIPHYDVPGKVSFTWSNKDGDLAARFALIALRENTESVLLYKEDGQRTVHFYLNGLERKSIPSLEKIMKQNAKEFTVSYWSMTQKTIQTK